MYAELALENEAIKAVLGRNVWSAPRLQGSPRLGDAEQFA
jgi:hypothetical protein